MARVLRNSCLFLTIIMLAVPLFAQQTGSISGKVTSDGAGLPGVTVEASSNVLPQPRVTVTGNNGEYSLPALQPGSYNLTFSLGGMQTVNRRAEVQLGQNTYADIAMGVQGLTETITVTAEATLVDRESTEIKSGISNELFQALPIAQEYRDLQKLIPGIAINQETVRGPSAGGSGQDNVYHFDGVNVTMPLFGVLVADPATHDIAQVNIVKGGARAIDFVRTGGFEIDSVSKSGTNKFFGQVSYQILNHGMIADLDSGTNTRFDEDRDWTTVNLGGPILRDRLFFYGSYYKPNSSRGNQSNLYGPQPDFSLDRTELFGKLTFNPTQSILINGSYRASEKTESGNILPSTWAATAGIVYQNELKIGTLEGSWVVSPKGFATFKYTDFRNPGGGQADFLVDDVTPSFALGTRLPLDRLDAIGQLTVPTLVGGNAAQNAFVQPFIDRYGYVQDGVRRGGGVVGFGLFREDNDDFYRKGGQIGFNYMLGSTITHDIHVGYQQYVDEEDRFQTSNGWGTIVIPGGTINCPANTACAGRPAFFQAIVSQQTTGAVPTIHSEFHSKNIELNDAIRFSNWTLNLGVLASNDTLYGQGLVEADNIAGFRGSPGVKYKMHNTPFGDMIQPRLGATWAYNGSDTVYASAARYNPAANSDARAASWDRNLVANQNVYFDETGALIGVSPVASSSGKWFQEGIRPRQTWEYMIGTGQQLTPNWSARVYGRHRKSDRFWEDTNNNARIAFGANVPGVKQELYVPNLGTNPTAANPAGTGIRGAIGSGSSYVIAELDGAFTKYYEASVESDWRSGPLSLRGSYTWSHYYGNFDQDNSSFNTANDAAIFIGSSNIADGAGRQLWDFKYGDLRGDRRNVVKAYGTYSLPWRASLGAFAVYQSGQPYQLESFLPYRALTTSTSDTNRYAESAGSRRSEAHHQADLNYTQNIPLPVGLNLQIKVDVFNLYNNQTGYNFETRVGTLGFTTDPNVDSVEVPASIVLPANVPAGSRIRAPFAKSFYDPRRYQVMVGVQF